jgi:hypothetical protein
MYDYALRNVEAERNRLAARVVELGRALKECSTMMAHARAFVTSRGRIKRPEGVYLYDQAMDRANCALTSDGVRHGGCDCGVHDSS